MDYVVCLHGLGRTKKLMRPIADALAQENYSVINETYPSTRYSVEELARQVRELVDQRCTDSSRSVHFVVHSLGGIILRYMQQHFPIQNIGRSVMIGTPNHGTEVADFLYRFAWFRKRYGPALMQLRTGDLGITSQLPSIVNFEAGVIAGDWTLDPWFSWFLLPGKNDGKVSVQSTKLENMHGHIVLHAPHPIMPKLHCVIKNTSHFLKYGSFEL